MDLVTNSDTGFNAGHPADLVSILCAMVFSLLCYLSGVVWASDLNGTYRWLLMSVCLVIAGAIAVPVWLGAPPAMVLIALLLLGANVWLGAKSCAAISRKRTRLFCTLSVSYLLGLLLGPAGVVLFCVPSVLIANRSGGLMAR